MTETEITEYKKEIKLVTERTQLALQAAQTIMKNTEDIGNEIIRLGVEELKKESDRELVRAFTNIYTYSGDEIKNNYQKAFYLRKKGIPVLINRENQTYKIPENEDELDDCKETERLRMIKKVAKLCHYLAHDPEKLAKLIETKTEVKEDETEDKWFIS